MKSIRLFGATLLISTTLLGVTGVFASESSTPNPKEEKTPITAGITVNQTPNKPTPPTDPDEGGADKPTDIIGLFGIAYAPDILSGQIQLNEFGEQKVSLSNKDVTKYNVGVQDKTRKKDQNWVLTASLTWEEDRQNYMLGTSIEASNGNVKENIAGQLKELRDKEVTTTASTLKIDSTETKIMQTNIGKTMNGVYNYQFERPHLIIPDVSMVPNGTYQGAIVWNLLNVPTSSEDSIINEAIQAVDHLFDGNSLNKDVTQQDIDTAKQLVNQVSNEQIQKELQEKIDKAQKLFDQKPIFQEITTTIKPTNTLNAGILMGSGHDRQDLGIQLEKDSVIKIKQINPNFKENLSLRLLTNDSHTESSINFSKDEVEVVAKDLSVPFIDTPYNQENGELPKVEIVVEGKKRELPKYNQAVSLKEFRKKWNTIGGYALLQGNRFQTLFPEENREKACSTNLNHVIDLYDNEIIGFYNDLIGLSDHSSNPINQASNRRYFYKADKHGAGGLYYGGSWSAQTSSSADAWLSDGWGVLHETGHGYQGKFMSKGMNTGEVWNNIYGVIYNYKHMSKEEADRSSWLYDYGKKAQLENYFKQLITNGNMNYNKQGVREQLLILSNLIDKAGNQGLQNFYKKYREYADQNDFDASNYLLPDLLIRNLGSPKKYDFSAVLTAWGLEVNNESKEMVRNNDFQPVSHLAQVVPENKLDEAINQLTGSNRLSSVLSLVTNNELKTLNLKSDLTLKFENQEIFDGVTVRLREGNKVYKEFKLDKKEITLKDIPNGVYFLEMEADQGYISSNPYIFVKENKEVTISLTGYLQEATEAVQQLFEDTECTKLKSTIMQKDINQAKEKVAVLPETEQKQLLLQKLATAFEGLQEITFGGYYNWTFATLDVSNSVATIRIYAGQPHWGYGTSKYATINISRNEQTIYEKDFIGEKSNEEEFKQIPLEDGDIVIITHLEANDARFAVNHSYLKNNNKGKYKYVIKNGLLKLVN